MEQNITQERPKREGYKGVRFKPSSLSPSTGLAAPHPLTGIRKRRAQRNTSETGERVVRDAPAQETHDDILKASSLAATTAVGVGGGALPEPLLPGGGRRNINGEKEIKCGGNV